MTVTPKKTMGVSAIVPARDEQDVIAACVESLVPQKEIIEILVVDDQSTDKTAEVVSGLAARFAHVRLLQITELPSGWVGKNNAAWMGASEAKGYWLLFTDADAVHESDSAAKALGIAARTHSVLVSFSPEQRLETWYEKSLLPYVYCRLGRRFSYAKVHDPRESAAAANGQFLLIRSDVYEAVGGHQSVASEVLEDVALAKQAKGAGYRIWFGSGRGIVRVRMYRSFRSMWQGWKKNLYPLMGGVGKEFLRSVLPVIVTIVATIATWGSTKSWTLAIGVFGVGLVALAAAYDLELRHNQFPARLIFYGIPGRLLFAAVLWASFRSHRKGKLEWKGRVYPAGTHGASNG